MRFAILLFFVICSCEATKSTSLSLDSITDLANSDSNSGDAGSDSDVVVQDKITEDVMALINNHRVDMGLDPLIHSNGLREIASTHSENMAKKTVAFGHTGFSGRCTSGRAVLGSANLCSENVAMGQTSAQSVFNAWINSAGHRANIEHPRVTHTGFGYQKSSGGVIYWTQIFLEKN